MLLVLIVLLVLANRIPVRLGLILMLLLLVLAARVVLLARQVRWWRRNLAQLGVWPAPTHTVSSLEVVVCGPILALIWWVRLGVLLGWIASRTDSSDKGSRAALERHHAGGLSRVYHSSKLRRLLLVWRLSSSTTMRCTSSLAASPFTLALSRSI